MSSLALAFDIFARDRASKTFKDVGDAAERTGKQGSSVGGMFAGLGKALTGAFAAVAVTDMFSGFIADARESAKIGRLTEAVITSTGGAAGVTAAQVNDLATAISNKTGADDEAIQSGANLLLTFTNVRNAAGKGNDIFNQATQAITDMSAALGQDSKASAIQLGKALNDPIKGVTALSKVGVSFTQQQKDQIKTLVKSGDTLGAQKVILGELNKEFGGAAAAAADPLQRLGVIAGNLGEQIGGMLLPPIEWLANLLGDQVIPAVSEFAEWIGPRIGPAIASAVGWIRGLGDSTSGAASKFGGIVTAIQAWWATALPIVQQFVDGMRARIEPLMPTIHEVFSTIGEIVSTAMELVKAVIERVTQAISYVWSNWGEGIMNVLGVAFGAVVGIIQGALNVVKGIISTVLAVIRGDWSGAWDGVKSIVSSAWQVISTAVSGGARTVLEIVRGLPGAIVNGLGNLGSLLYSAGVDLIRGLINGIKDMAGRVAEAAGSVVSNAIDAAKQKLGIASPSKVFMTIGRQTGEGYALGLGGSGGMVSDAMSRLLAVPSMPAVAGGVAGGMGGFGMPSSLTVVDSDGALIGRMRVEASGVVADVGQLAANGRRDY